MGMVVTTTEEPPPQDSISCVPRRWVVESTFKPTKVTTNRALAKWGACIGVLVRFVSVVVPASWLWNFTPSMINDFRLEQCFYSGLEQKRNDFMLTASVTFTLAKTETTTL